MTKEIFGIYIETQLASTLDPGDVVILDNLPSYNSEKANEILKGRDAWFLFLPPYSPDLNPSKIAFSKLKAHLRRIRARTIDDLSRAVRRLFLALDQQPIGQGRFRGMDEIGRAHV